MCRTAIYLWVNYAIAPQKSQISTPQLKKISDYYDRKKAQFSSDPEAWGKYLLDRRIKTTVASFTRSFREIILPLVEPAKVPRLEEQMSLTEKVLADSLSSEQEVPMKKSEASKGFGVLIHSQTAAYACKVLYRELCSELKVKSRN